MAVMLIVFKANGLVIWYNRKSVRADILGCFAPAAALAAKAGFTIHMLEYGGLVWAAALVGVASVVFAYSRLANSSTQLGSAISLGVAGALAAYGLGVALDAGLDRSSAKTFVATVTNAHVSHGRSTTYYLDLPAWSDQPAGEVAVSSSLYDSAPVGSEVCISRRSGELGLAWFDVALCPPGRIQGPPRSSARQPAGVANPDWITTPTGQDLADLYPERAQRLGQTGAATIRCSVQVTGSLADCIIIEETPPGFGFGAATLEAAGRFRMRPKTVNGQPVAGGTVTMPIRWQLG